MNFEELTKNERMIIFMLRELRAHERLEIMADQKGREDYYIVTKTLREILA
jgi:hypothetical protein